MKSKLLIFDLDGTLFDTSLVNYYAYKKCLNKYGYDIEKDYFIKYCNGYHYTTFIPKIVGNDIDILEKIHQDKKDNYSKNLKYARINSFLFEIIDAFKDNCHIALVTTASKKNCYEILDYFDKRKYFELIMTAEDVKKQKPDPYGYNKAIENFKVKKENTYIFEDSDVGIQSAINSGANVITIAKF